MAHGAPRAPHTQVATANHGLTTLVPRGCGDRIAGEPWRKEAT